MVDSPGGHAYQGAWARGSRSWEKRQAKILQAQTQGNVTLDRMRIKSKASDAATGANVYRRRTQPSRVSRLTAG